MPFFCLQRAVDLLLLFLLWEKYGTCRSCPELFDRFHHLDGLSQIGTVAVLLIVVVSLGDAIRRVVAYLSARSKRHVEGDKT